MIRWSLFHRFAELQAAGRHYHILSATNGEASGINLGTMHRAKGLEFKVVVVIDVSDGHVPPAWIYRGIKDPQAREEALQRELQLLYVSARDARVARST